MNMILIKTNMAYFYCISLFDPSYTLDNHSLKLFTEQRFPILHPDLNVIVTF